MIKNIIFDWSGVCTKGGMSDPMCQELAKHLGITKDRIKVSFKKLEDPYVKGLISGEEFLDRLLKDLEIKFDISKLKNALVSAPELNKSIFDLIVKLKQKYTIILFSDNSKEMTDFIQQKYHINRFFDTIILSNEEGLRKPDRKIYETMIKKSAIDPEESLFIDDREKNLKPAEEFGIKTILFENNQQLKRDLNKLGITF